MGMVLSIYSQKGFREVTLPEKGEDELEIVIQKELFSLEQDIWLTLAQEESGWRLQAQNASIKAGAEILNSALISNNLHLEIEGAPGDCITIICFEQINPFAVYQKYSLAGLQQISIGRTDNNNIQYQNDFVSSAHCTIELDGKHVILHDTSRNGTFLNFRRVYGNAILNYGDSIRIMRLNIIYLGNMIAIDDCDNLTVKFEPLAANAIHMLAAEIHSEPGRKVLFHRSPRHLRPLYIEPFEIEAPPNPPENREPPLIMSVGPALTMAIPMALGTLLSAWASSSGNGNSAVMMYTGLITAIGSAVIGAIWAVLNVRYTAKTRKKDENRRFERYSEYLIHMRDEIEKAHHENAKALKELYHTAEECCALNETSPLLWNRNQTQDDFLSVRLGMGEIPFQAPIEIPKEKFTLINDSLADKPKVIRENFSRLRNVPVTVDMLQNRLVGIVGGNNRKTAIAIAKAIIAQIATANSYTDVKLALVYDSASDIDRETWDFALWLPHVWSGDKKIRYIATNPTEMSDVFHALFQILRTRSEEARHNRQEKTVAKPQIVLFITNPLLLDREPIAQYVFDKSVDLGLTTILLCDRPENLPNQCECIIENDETYQGLFNTKLGRANGMPVQFDGVSEDSLCALAKSLGRIEVVESELGGDIPNSLSFFDMYGVERPQDLNAADRWKRSNSVTSMKALVGFRNGNAPCYLDIHERYHGPHGLVAGTTGSGKSETLQTYILSLAVNFSPEDIGFFVIDYKGGGMANLFDNLPHMIGSISNLSGNQVKRAMVSIQSENRRRQRIFTEYGVNNINSYTTLYKNGDAVEPVPHLFIIIDEFAELKREEPEFMKELISVAQVGRSLGVHLILSTQRPSGTVDENIWANSKFRLCLRVQDRQDSMDMLHRPEAAYLTQAGRCYLQVGNDEIFELFQSGWSGASYDEELGGGSLLIAEMLSATGKVDLAVNHAKIKRKEELKHHWVKHLIEILHIVEQETNISVLDDNFDFNKIEPFRKSFYSHIHNIMQDFEENQFNNSRIEDFCSVYQAVIQASNDVSQNNNASSSANSNPRIEALRAAYRKSRQPKTIDELVKAIILRASQSNKRLPEVKSKTQLEVTVDYLRNEAERLGMAKIRKLWLPVLPNYLYLEDLEPFARRSFNGTEWSDKPSRFQLSAVIGMADDPANQAQMPISLDFTTGGHHMIIGTVSTGKSTFLQSVIYSLVMTYTPDLLNVYCLDFSAKMLSVFSDLKHVGGYMDESDLETDQISKFFTMISRILDERKERLAGASFEDYVNHDGWNLPAILIVIDNYGSFHEKTGETYEAIMNRIAKEGNSYGLFLLVSAGGIGMQELPNRLAETFRTGIALEMPDEFAYSDILHVVRPPVLPESRTKGRGLAYHGSNILEFQTALSVRSESAPDRNDLIKEDVERMNAAYTGAKARAVPRIPDKPVRADFTELPEYTETLAKPELMPIGYNFEFADIYSFDLRESFVYLVTGAKNSGKSVFMENLILTALDKGDQVVILELGDINEFGKIAEQHKLRRYTDDQGIHDFLTALNSTLVERSPLKEACLDKKASNEELFECSLQNPRIDIFISNMQALIDLLNNAESKTYSARETFDIFCERGKGYNIFLYAEISDKEQLDLMGYTCFDNMYSYRSGIRFGGRFNDQRIFPFENIGYQDQDRSMKSGVGVIPSENREDSLVRIVVPMC